MKLTRKDKVEKQINMANHSDAIKVLIDAITDENYGVVGYVEASKLIDK